MNYEKILKTLCLSNKKKLTLPQLRDISFRVISILIQDNNIINLRSPIKIFGDIHGQFHDLYDAIACNNEDIYAQFDQDNSKYLFLGDFVDRGSFSVKTISLILLLKILNHETRAINQAYGFYEECLNYFNQGSEAWTIFNEIFDHLPLVAIVDNRYFCVHGGISPHIKTLKDLELVDRFKEIPANGELADLIWSDPDQGIKNWKLSPRGSGNLFGYEELKQFLKINDLSTVIRSHQTCQIGYKWDFEEMDQEKVKNSILTIWSAPNYSYTTGNKAAYVNLEEGFKLKCNSTPSGYLNEIEASKDDPGHVEYTKNQK
ncbi:serine/threonine-protein phosphatase pp2a-like ppg1 [Anaeramoeba flamelloides]|uniref:protein-serine/threonine phosphatase n=1 Tax=Anaeramoeba flamelloides TaxID=1746091 RepID=A0ABQ8XIU9_9EUKA|nr:serine/threonine-protein phosphatase pp2a-like ppg1 [Anaeramoeba flamelloides]